MEDGTKEENRKREGMVGPGGRGRREEGTVGSALGHSHVLELCLDQK